MAAANNPILTKIKQALADAHLPVALPNLPPQPVSPFNGDPASLIEPFTRELAALNTKVTVASSPTHAIELALQVVGDSGAKELLAWDDGQLPVDGLGAALRDHSYSILDANLPSDPTVRREKLAELGRAGLGITGALAGMADTGTLALTSGAGRPRLASLLPPAHLALLPIRHLLPSLPHLFAQHSSLVEQGSNLILVTGPSRTADIELTPVFGVHGPKTVHVILV